MTIAGKCSPVGGASVGGTAPLTFTPASPGSSVTSDLQILWDFDNDGDWSESVEDITSYVMFAEIATGRDYPSSLTGEAGPAQFKLTLNNDDDRFSYFNSASPLNADPFSLKTGRLIRARTTDAVNGASLITYVGSGAGTSGDNASLSPALPTGLVSAALSPDGNADLMLIVASIRNSGTGTVNTPSGWAPLATFGNVSLLGRFYEDGDTAPTVTFSGGVANATTLAQCFAFRGVRQSLGACVSLSTTQLNGSAQDVAYPALAVTEDDNAVLAIGWKQDDDTGVAQLSGFTEIVDLSSTTGDDASMAVDYKIQTTAATITSGSFTWSGGAAAISRAIMVALRPALDRTDPVLLARDRFTQAGQPTLAVDEFGTAWATQSGGGFGVHNHTASAASGLGATYNTSIISTIDVGVTDMYVQASIPLQVQDGRVGLIARFTDTSNYTRAYYDESTRSLVVEDVSGGVVTQLGSDFFIEAWDGMTMGLGIVDQEVTLYLGGVPLDFGTTLTVPGTINGTKAGIYGRWQVHSDTPPAVDDFYVWDKVRGDIAGVMFTGAVVAVSTSVKAGESKVVTVNAEGVLAIAAGVDVAAPRIIRRPGESASNNYSVPAGAIVGDIMARVGLSHPPHPLPTTPTSHLGPHAVGDGKALDLARAVELAERGFIRETPEGGVTFEDRDYRGALSSRAWFSDTAGTGQYPIQDIVPLDQSTQIVNRAIARVAASAPTVVDVSNQGDDSNPLDVAFTIPTVMAGQLLLVFIACSADATDVEFGCPPPWKELRQLRQREGNGMRIYSLICDGSESGSTVYFYKGTSQGTFIAHAYVIDNWYGTDDGVKVGRPSSGALSGTNAYPLSPGWSRAPSLFIVFQCAIGASSGILWGPLDTPPPIGYDYDSLEGLVFVTSPVVYETGVESVYKFDVTDTEDPRPWEDVFTDYLLLETVVVAVRGYDGPLGKPTLDNPNTTGGQGLFVTVDDVDSQLDHNAIRTNPDIPVFAYTEADARNWCNDVLAEFADDRPIISIRFTASKNALLRALAASLRVSDRVTVTATGNSGLGIEGDFHVEHVTHSWSSGVSLWETTYELSPAN